MRHSPLIVLVVLNSIGACTRTDQNSDQIKSRETFVKPPRDVAYNGGPVLSNVEVHAVFWGRRVDTTVTAQMGAFFRTLTGAPFDWLSEYDTPTQSIGRGKFTGASLITPANKGAALVTRDIGAEVVAQIATGTLPAPNANSFYAVFLPPGVTVSFGPLTSCQSFCGLHGAAATKKGDPVYCLLIPDYAPGSGCDKLCGEGTAFENICAVSSHELIEGVTDPANVPNLAWNDDTYGEVGDICNGTRGFISGVEGTFTVQANWSNKVGACVVSGKAINDFALMLSDTPSSPGRAVFAIDTVLTRGYFESITLSIPDLPDGMTAAFQPTMVTTGGSSTLTLTFGPDAPAIAKLTLVATSPSAMHKENSTLNISGATPANGGGQPDPSGPPSPSAPSLTPSVTSLNLSSGSSVDVIVSVPPDATSPLTPTVDGLPPGVTATFPATVKAGDSFTLTLRSTNILPSVSTVFNIVANNGVAAYQTSIALTVEGQSQLDALLALDSVAERDGVGQHAQFRGRRGQPDDGSDHALRAGLAAGLGWNV